MAWRIGSHVVLCIVGAVMAMFLVPVFWSVMNQTFWANGMGHVLTERPVAAAHHRMMAGIREYDNRVDRMGSLERQLQFHPDSTDRAVWQAELDQARAERNRFFAKWFAVFAVCYIPVGLFIEGWRRWGPHFDLEGEPFASY